ncbi:MAG: PRD domain-containing protein, partial [Tetragenococcus sp.]|nr:PRD domain-containing protein [Tetragenococcus sp.]
YFDDNNIESLALHLDTLIEKVNEGYSFHDEKFLEHKKKGQVEKEKEFQIAKKIYQEVSSRLQVELPESETYFISLYLKAMNEKYTKQKIGVLVLMHGENAAGDLAQTANKLLNVNHAVGLNMPLSQTVGNTLESATKIVEEIDQGKGVVLLSDMGSLNMFGEIIMSKLGIQTKTIKMVTTPMVVEATRKAMLPEMSLEKLEQDIIEQSTFIGNSVQTSNDQSSANIVVEYENRRREKIIYILEENLIFLDGTTIYDLLEEQAKIIVSNFPIESYEDFWIKFLFHTSNMVERAIRKEQFERKEAFIVIDQSPNLYRFLKSNFSSIENRFAINIADSEFSYLMELIDVCIKSTIK